MMALSGLEPKMIPVWADVTCRGGESLGGMEENMPAVSSIQSALSLSGKHRPSLEGVESKHPAMAN